MYFLAPFAGGSGGTIGPYGRGWRSLLATCLPLLLPSVERAMMRNAGVTQIASG